MSGLKPETVKAILADEFATATIKAAIEMLLIHARDWETISRSGKIRFVDEQSAIAYAAMQTLINQTEEPSIDATVVVSGQRIQASALQELQKSFRRQP